MYYMLGIMIGVVLFVPVSNFAFWLADRGVRFRHVYAFIAVLGVISIEVICVSAGDPWGCSGQFWFGGIK